MVQYDPNIIQKAADRLYAEAGRIQFMCAFAGVIIGALALIAATNDAVFTIAGAVGCGFLGGMYGYSRGFALRLRAQLALCQMQNEANTRIVAHAMGQQRAA